MSCIHWVERQDLPALEHVMQKKLTERLNVGVMMAGQGAMKDVFSETYRFLKDRKKREEALAMDMAKKAYTPAQEQARRYAHDLVLLTRSVYCTRERRYSDASHVYPTLQERRTVLDKEPLWLDSQLRGDSRQCLCNSQPECWRGSRVISEGELSSAYLINYAPC